MYRTPAKPPCASSSELHCIAHQLSLLVPAQARRLVREVGGVGEPVQVGHAPPFLTLNLAKQRLRTHIAMDGSGGDASSHRRPASCSLFAPYRAHGRTGTTELSVQAEKQVRCDFHAAHVWLIHMV